MHADAVDANKGFENSIASIAPQYMSALGALSGKDQFIAKLFYLEIFIWKHRQHFIAQFIVNNKKSAIDQ